MTPVPSQEAHVSRVKQHPLKQLLEVTRCPWHRGQVMTAVSAELVEGGRSVACVMELVSEVTDKVCFSQEVAGAC